MTVLDIRGCLDDSPTFRKRVQAHEESIQNFEQILKTLIKLTRSQVELSAAYSQQQKELAETFLSFAQAQDDPIVAQALEKFGKSVVEVEKSRSMFNTHVTDMFIMPLDLFVKETITPIKELKKKFEKSSDDVDSALSRYMSKKPKDPTLQESAKELADTRKTFHKVYMEYVSKLNDIEAKKKIDYMENVLAYMYTESAFHHQSYEILKDLEPYMRDLTGLLYDTRQRYSEEVDVDLQYQKTHEMSTADQYNPMQNAADIEKPAAITNKSGYLFERKNGRVYQSWSRKYYSISNGELTSISRNPKTKDEDGTQTYNLRVCSVKYSDSYDRRFCFEVISPNRVLVLQAENENDMNEWIQSIRTASQLALNSDEKPRYSHPSPNLRKMAIESASVAKTVERQGDESNKEAVKKIRLVPGNDKCADCKEDSPEWACTNLGIIVCIECSGIHRSLGVHVSKVRSVVLDNWESETIEVMLQLGNEVGNSIYEESVPAHLEEFRIDPSSHRNDRDLWIIEKYVKRSFVSPAEVDQVTLDKNFWNSIAENDLQHALRYLAQGANVDYRNTEEGLKTALHKAVDNNNEVAVEFLLQRPSDVDEKDERGWTALHYAAANNNVRLVLTLLKRHAKADIADNSNMTPLDIAVEKQFVQAVTALRLFAFDKQHNASPSSSLDFGFREAMSAFKHTCNERPNITSSHSAVDISHTKPMVSKSDVVLLDDQNSELLHPDK
ncbi:ArfGap-domain-containing protein [Rhizopus microsporus var. microsporus]|uniref:ArfGap-domain-containing protein n=2 Tax=Rhizopus microsporus TaxID=58291 RepID=A0A2G4T9I0_RHIZD|nr:ArfGap-domain-containing protein [Rhizopus microsporus ATCC 52813]ORE11849.1 ArfGap-domain-containing protein [Rhizopus microsporus var. microsporus]PHZ17670.1 ArfGap-domain-containing protein [Rhizopus microsporus ATCC 52813]